MRAHVSTFWTAKEGATPEEYEDSAAVAPDTSHAATGGEFAGAALSAAVADGASEAFLAGKWARELTRQFVLAEQDLDFAAVIEQAVEEWDRLVAEYLQDRERRGRPIRWYEEPGLERGAYAALTGMRLFDESQSHKLEGQFMAWALGDSCLFQVRGDELIVAFPIDDASVFDNSPPLVPSRGGDLDAIAKRVDHYSGHWRSGDTFYLATDALAQWFLRAATTGDEPWMLLRDLDTLDGPGSFNEWVDHLRLAREIRNDDTTLVRIDVY